MGVSQGHPWARQRAHVKWKTVALPRLLGYAHRRLSDFQSWLSSKKKGKRSVPARKKKCSLLQGMPFSPLKCSQQVLLAPPRRILSSTVFCVVAVLKGSAASQGTTVSGWGMFWKTSSVGNHLLPSGADVRVPGMGNHARKAKTQQPRMASLCLQSRHSLHTTQMSSEILNQLDMADLII